MPTAVHTPSEPGTAFNAGRAIATLWRQHHTADLRSIKAATPAAKHAAHTHLDDLFAQVTEATHQACRSKCETPADIAAMAVTCHNISGLIGVTEGEHKKRCMDSLLAATANLAVAAAKLGTVRLGDLASAHEVRQINRLARAAA